MAITQNNLDPSSQLRLARYIFQNPIAAAVNSIVTSVDPSGLTLGAALTQATAFATTAVFRHARRPTLVLTDASGGAGGLSVTVRIKGSRFGVFQQEDLTVTCTDGNATTGTAENAYDQISSITTVTITSAASGDALTMGITGALGFPFAIDRVEDVQLIYKIVSGNTETIIAVSSTTVDVTRSMLVHGTTITKANDVFEVQLLRSLNKDTPGIGHQGAFA